MWQGWARELEIGLHCIQRTTTASTMMSLLRQLNLVACTQKKKQKSPVLIRWVPRKACSELSVVFSPKRNIKAKYESLFR